MVATNDIIVLTETHLVGEGSIKKVMPQGSCLFTVGGSTSRGGVAIWVSRRIAGNVVLLGKSEIPKGMESIWVKLKGQGLAMQGRNLVIGACYAAPIASRIYTQNRSGGNNVSERVTSRLSTLIERHQGPYDEVLVMGDLNARVAGLRELPEMDAERELEEVTGFSAINEGLLMGIPERNSKDIDTNAFGRALVKVCREREMVILNGRVTGDMEGKCTFRHINGRGNSMIDLFIASAALFLKPLSSGSGTSPLL